MNTYYVTAQDQYGESGYITMIDGLRVCAGSRLSYLFDLETRISDSVVAKAVDAGLALKATLNTVIVECPEGAPSTDTFIASLGEVRKSAIIRSYSSEGVTMVEFDRAYALGIK